MSKLLKRIKDSEKLYPSYKSESYGTENYYKVNGFTGTRLVMTDGVKMLFEVEQCYWIGDIVASYFPKITALSRQKDETFFVVRITKNLTTDGVLFSLDDGRDSEEGIYITQKIPYSDIKMNIALYLQTDGERWVLMCREEY